MKSEKKCIYCKKYKTKGDKCVVCNSFICWNCLFDNKTLKIIVNCSKCERLICSNCLLNCECQSCGKYVCSKCKKICEVCKRTICDACYETITIACSCCGNEGYINICDSCLDKPEITSLIIAFTKNNPKAF